MGTIDLIVLVFVVLLVGGMLIDWIGHKRRANKSPKPKDPSD